MEEVLNAILDRLEAIEGQLDYVLGNEPTVTVEVDPGLSDVSDCVDPYLSMTVDMSALGAWWF